MIIEINYKEAAMLTAALGVFKNRIGQRASWYQRKRLPVLRQNLATAIIIGEETETQLLKKVINNLQTDINNRIEIGNNAGVLMRRIKQAIEDAEHNEDSETT